jgi:gliding motility-associated-like protein
VRIRVLAAERVYLPNVFSPDDDGENDRLVAHFGGEVAEVLSARVYDRWGGLVAEQKGVPTLGAFEVWDGAFRGKPAAPGVYAAVLVLRLLDGQVVQTAGDISLIR